MKSKISLRPISEKDCYKIEKAFQLQGWDKPASQYQKYFQLQSEGKRDVIIADWEDEFAGYLTINWNPGYSFFKKNKIPEIVDFNVLKKFQRKGIGTILMDEAESRVKKVSPIIGLGYGILPDYGAAQILYAKRGYIPDGNGLINNGSSVNYGDQVIIDDGLIIYMTKKLR